jgi:hypothetical protein
MATSLIVFMKEEKPREFPHVGRAGGNYTKSIRYEGGFVIIKDEWNNETAIPSVDIREVKVSNHR